MPPTIDDLLPLSPRALGELIREGHAIAPDALDDTLYEGVSLGLPRWVEKLSWKKFAKTFHRDPSTGRLRGWNVRMEQNGLDGEWVAQQRGGRPRTFGHFGVREAAGTRTPRGFDRGLLLDYTTGGNAVLDPMGWMIRDPLVALEPGRSDLLLGGSYLELGAARVVTPAYFVLRRGRPLDHTVDPPRRRPALPAPGA